MLEYMSGSPQKIELVFVVCSDSSVNTASCAALRTIWSSSASP